MNNTFTGHNTFIFLFPTRPRAFFLALICSGCDGPWWVDPRVYPQSTRAARERALVSTKTKKGGARVHAQAFIGPMIGPSSAVCCCSYHTSHITQHTQHSRLATQNTTTVLVLVVLLYHTVVSPPVTLLSWRSLFLLLTAFLLAY